MTLSIVTTMFNEVDNLPEFVALVSNVRTTFKLDIPVLLVDNGSTDDTSVFFKANFSDLGFLTLFQNPPGSSYAEGIERALLLSNRSYALFIPSDMQFDLTDVASVISVFLSSTNKGRKLHCPVLSVRSLRRDGIQNVIRGEFWRRIVIGVLNFDRRLDPASQLRILCIDCLEKIDSRNFLWDIESLFFSIKKAISWKVVHVSFYPRKFGSSSLIGSPLLSEFNALRGLCKIKKRLGTL